jgi:hypothetical protein
VLYPQHLTTLQASAACDRDRSFTFRDSLIFLDSLLTDGGEVPSLKPRPLFVSKTIPDAHFC